MRHRHTKTFTVTALFLAATAFSAVAHAQGVSKSAQAEVLFQQGREALNSGDLDTACASFQASHELDPAVGTLLNLATCEERRGHTVKALELFASALDKLPKSDKRYELAQTHVLALTKRLPKLELVIHSDAPRGTFVKDYKISWLGLPVPLAPGPHTFVIESPGRHSRTFTVTLTEGRITRLVVEPGRPLGENPSHAWQLGLIARIDIDGLRAGVVPALGASYGIGDHVEVSVAALAGKSKGVEPAATGYILKGPIKPRVTFAVPIFFVDGVRPGLRPAVGVQWDPIRYFGVFAEAGVSIFPNAPTGVNTVVFVPSVGVQGRVF